MSVSILFDSEQSITKLRKLTIEGLITDGRHHKQWFLEQILIELGVDLNELAIELEGKGWEWERGIAP